MVLIQQDAPGQSLSTKVIMPESFVQIDQIDCVR